MTEDTETLLAILASLLTKAVPDTSVLLNALVESEGDVQLAAQRLKSQVSQGTSREKDNPASSKRQRATDLNEWLKPRSSKVRITSDRPTSTRQLDSSNDHSDSHRAETSTKAIQLISNSSSRSIPPSKPIVDLMTVLRQPPSPAKDILRLPPLTLSNPEMVAKHTPCTLHLSILPPELACRLFYAMLDESQKWKRNKWWLFERLVESPHRTSFYARRPTPYDDNSVDTGDETWHEASQYWFNGCNAQRPQYFPDVLEEACGIVERVVNEEMKKRKRFPLEWCGGASGVWRANVAAANCYEGAKEGVGFHADHMTYLGPYPTIASISLGTSRVFRLREVVPSDQKQTRHPQTFNIPLPHNSLVIMHGSTQERFKHSIPPQSSLDVYRPSHPRSPDCPLEPSNCRINITFRFYRPDFHPSTIPRCKCGVPTALRADMKNRQDGKTDKYLWHCNAAVQNDGKDCGFWKVMNMKAEGRGPCVQDVAGEARQ